MSTENDTQAKLVWGLEGIGKVINRSARQTHYLLQKGAIPGRLIAGRWVADRDALLKIADPEKDERF